MLSIMLTAAAMWMPTSGTMPVSDANNWQILFGNRSSDEAYLVEVCARAWPDDKAERNQCEFVAFKNVLDWNAETAAYRVMHGAPDDPRQPTP